jgi:hypothetical protein
VNRPAPCTVVHSQHLPAYLGIPPVGDAAAPLVVRACAPGAAVAFPSRAGRTS